MILLSKNNTVNQMIVEVSGKVVGFPVILFFPFIYVCNFQKRNLDIYKKIIITLTAKAISTRGRDGKTEARFTFPQETTKAQTT